MSKLAALNVTLRGISTVELLLVTPPCRVTVFDAKPPVNVEMVDDSPEAETIPIGMHEPSNNSIIKMGEKRFMYTPGDVNERDPPSSALSLGDRTPLNFNTENIVPGCYLPGPTNNSAY